jgi:hypothetical protein
MKTICPNCSRQFDGSPIFGDPGTIGGGRPYKGTCPEHGEFLELVVMKPLEAKIRWEESKAILICPTGKREWPAESSIVSKELGSKYRVTRGHCAEDGPLFHRGS